MNINNKILEAVNRGIKLALDDYEDIEDSNPISHQSDVISDDDIMNIKVQRGKFESIIKDKFFNLTLTKEDLVDLAWLSDKYGFKHQFTNNKELLTGTFRYIALIDPDADLNWIDTSNITDMSELFAKQNISINFDISKWDVSNVTNMERMFENQELFNCNLSHWDVSNVIFMMGMFYNCKRFDWDLSDWDVSSAELMDYMFYGSGMKHDISNWDVSNVTSHYSFASNMYMFPLKYQPKFKN